jgi:hypothetical protein
MIPGDSTAAGVSMASEMRSLVALRTSEALSALGSEDRERLSVADIVERLGERSFGAIFLLLAFAAFIPSIPGFTGLLGLAFMLVSGQLIVGRRFPWLPGFIAHRSVSREAYASAYRRLVPWLRRLETLARPRMAAATGTVAERVVGLVVFLLGVVIALPIPFLGNIPPASAILVFALGLIERDGLLILAGFAVSAAAFALSGTLGLAAAAQLARLL